MTVEEKQEWLEIKYPLTIISDRYDGTYSGGGWLAFPLYCDEVPPAVDGYDEECAAFWKDYSEPVGKGNSAQAALDDLIKQMHEFKPEESEDERIRKAIVCGMNVLKEQKKETFAAVPINDCLAWLEKQKDILGERAKNITANMFEDGIKGIQRELIEFLSNTVNASWVDIIWSADAYAERIRNTIKKQKEQEHPDGCFTCDEYKKGYEAGRLHGFTAGYNKAMKEQKPAEWKPTEEQFNYLAKAIMTLGEEGDCKTAGVLSEIRKGLKCSFPDWKVSPDYPEEGCNVSLNGEVKKIQEWSEEDEKMKNRLIDRLNFIAYRQPTDATTVCMSFESEITWLKSLPMRCPKKSDNWKPSEEQMKALSETIAFMPDTFKTKCTLETFQNDLKKHM